MSWVYFIQPVNGGPIRIGYSRDTEKRLMTLAVWCPYELKILCRMPGDSLHEAFFHHKFRVHRLHGEWFAPVPEILDAVAIISQAGTFPGMPEPAPITEHRRECNLSSLIARLGMTKQEFIAAMGISPSSLPNWRAPYSVPDNRIPQIIDLAASRGVTITAAEINTPRAAA